MTISIATATTKADSRAALERVFLLSSPSPSPSACSRYPLVCAFFGYFRIA